MGISRRSGAAQGQRMGGEGTGQAPRATHSPVLRRHVAVTALSLPGLPSMRPGGGRAARAQRPDGTPLPAPLGRAGLRCSWGLVGLGPRTSPGTGSGLPGQHCHHGPEGSDASTRCPWGPFLSYNPGRGGPCGILGPARLPSAPRGSLEVARS